MKTKRTIESVLPQQDVVEGVEDRSHLNCTDCAGEGLNQTQTAVCPTCAGTGKI